MPPFGLEADVISNLRKGLAQLGHIAADLNLDPQETPRLD